MPKVEQEKSWHAFIQYVLPDGMTSRAALATQKALPAGGASARSSSAANLRRVRNGGVALPSISTVWEAAESTRTLPARSWCASPLFLFAAAHYDWYALLIVEVDDVYVPVTRKAVLIASTIDAVDFREPSLAEAIERVKASSVSDVLKRRNIDRLIAEGPQVATPARTAWTLSVDEESAFHDALLRTRRDDADPALFIRHRSRAVVTAWLARRHPEIGLACQREIVTATLRRELMP